MMIQLMIAAAALAEATTSSTMAGPADTYDLRDGGTVVVKADRSALRHWKLPKLHYEEAKACSPMTESVLPGFGTVRIGPHCATEEPEEWRLFQY